MKNKSLIGVTKSKVQNQKKSNQSVKVKDMPVHKDYSTPEFDSFQIYLKREIMFTAMDNDAGYENHTFINRLDELKSLKWVCINMHEYYDILDEVPTKYLDEKRFESRFLDIYFESKNHIGDHLIVERYRDKANKNEIFYSANFIKTHKVEDGVFYYSLYMFRNRYKRIQYLKNAVAGFEICRKEFGIKSKFSWEDIEELALNPTFF